MKKQNVRTLSLIVCTFTYLLVGAAVFDALESEFEIDQKRQLFSHENEIIRKYNISEEDLRDYIMTIVKAIPHRAGKQWKFAGAFYFATTVITTIGYGHSTPQTVGGKIFCMFYALAGIPLNIVMFQSVGERLNVFITFILKSIKKCFRFRDPSVSQTNLIFVTMNMSTIVLTAGAAAFAYNESWTYINAVYYCFITLTTIGFGDYVALQKNKALTDNPQYVAFSLIFLLVGLSVLSAAMNLLVLRFLTMNTDDERRDEMEAAAAAQCAARLDGDVISAANENIVSRAQENPQYSDLTSVCSCSCYDFRSSQHKFKHRYKVTRSPGKISHLLPMQSVRGKEDADSMLEDANSVIHYHMLNAKRASI